MTVVKRISKDRRGKIQHLVARALGALEHGASAAVVLEALDHAMKLFNGEDNYIPGEMRYDQLNDACEAFLEEVQLPTLAVAIADLNHWRGQEPFVALGKAAYAAGCDMQHYFRCEGWVSEVGKRRTVPNMETCTCGLRELTQAHNAIPLEETE